MKNIGFNLLVLLVLAGFVLSACGGAATQAPVATEAPAMTEAPAATEAPMATEVVPVTGNDFEGEVAIVAWAGYIENGSTDPAYDWVTEFESQTSCKVTVKTAATSDEMVTLMNQGGYDLVTASGDASNRLIAGGKVQEIDISRIPSWDTVDERLQDAPWHTVDGKHYGVPYQWGPNVLMYNTEVFPEAPTSWDVTFVEMNLPDGKSNSGRVQAYDGPIYLADAALYLKFHNPELGIENPYDLNQEQFDAVVALLTAQRPLISRYWHDAYVQMDDFVNEGVVASGSWPFQVNFMDGVSVASTIPQEGATGWADTTMMHVDAPHPNCAYAWMEWSLNPKLQGDLASWFGSVPAVPAACTGNELLTDEGCATNGFDNFEKIWFWRTPTAACSTGAGDCIPYSQWVDSYIAIISQ
jgi:putative spermidine/putrescine transport system substrate-binding protein